MVGVCDDGPAMMMGCVGLRSPSESQKKSLQSGIADTGDRAPAAITPRARPSNFDMSGLPRWKR